MRKIIFTLLAFFFATTTACATGSSKTADTARQFDERRTLRGHNPALDGVVNRMESTGQAMSIHVSESTWQQTKSTFDYKDIAEIEVKGKGVMKTYFL